MCCYERFHFFHFYFNLCLRPLNLSTPSTSFPIRADLISIQLLHQSFIGCLLRLELLRVGACDPYDISLYVSVSRASRPILLNVLDQPI